MLRVTVGCDRTVGRLLLIVGLVVCLYYVFWVLLLPLLPIESDHFFRHFFPQNALIWGIAIPVAFGTLFFLSVAVFAFIQMNNSVPSSDVKTS
jgi:hypothetical protein